jgi:hypothetical protein
MYNDVISCCLQSLKLIAVVNFGILCVICIDPSISALLKALLSSLYLLIFLSISKRILLVHPTVSPYSI